MPDAPETSESKSEPERIPGEKAIARRQWPSRTVSPLSVDGFRTPGRLLQPLTIAGVCFAFIAFSLGAGWLNQRRLDAALSRSVASRGETAAAAIATAAAAVYQRITAPSAGFASLAEQSDADDLGEFHNSLLAELSDLAAGLAAGRLSPPEALNQGASGAAVLNPDGEITETAGELPPDVIVEVGPVARGETGIAIRLFNRLLNQARTGFLAQGRGAIGGAAVVAVSAERFRERAREFAMATAVRNADDIGAGWLIAENKDRSVVARSGTLADAAAEMIPANDETIRRLRVDGRPLLEVVKPVSLDAVSAGTLRVGLPADETVQLLERNRRHLWISTGFLAVLAVIAVLFLVRNQQRHDARIRRMERRIQGARRLSALGRLAGGVAHEIRNPLNAIGIAVQRLSRKYPDPLMDVVREEIRRLDTILEEFLTVARHRDLMLRPGDLRDVMAAVVALMTEAAADAGVSLETNHPAHPCPVVLDPDRMKQAILNLVKNALEATPSGGTVRIAIQAMGREELTLMVSDSGIGIPPPATDRIFDLDFTTKERGVGLGLPLAHEIVRGHGGVLRMLETGPDGTVFEVRLPKAAEGNGADAYSHR